MIAARKEEIDSIIVTSSQLLEQFRIFEAGATEAQANLALYLITLQKVEQFEQTELLRLRPFKTANSDRKKAAEYDQDLVRYDRATIVDVSKPSPISRPCLVTVPNTTVASSRPLCSLIFELGCRKTFKRSTYVGSRL